MSALNVKRFKDLSPEDLRFRLCRTNNMYSLCKLSFLGILEFYLETPENHALSIVVLEKMSINKPIILEI